MLNSNNNNSSFGDINTNPFVNYNSTTLPGSNFRQNNTSPGTNTTNLCDRLIKNICVLILFVVVFSALLSLSIASIVIADKNQNAVCISSYSDISFNYTTWLQIMGWTNIVVIIITFLSGVGYILYETSAIGICGISFLVLNHMFQFTWYIVGTILFFETVNSSCKDSNSSLYLYGLALFIIQTIGWVFTCCGSGANSSKK